MEILEVIDRFSVACTETVRTSTTAPRYLSTGSIETACEARDAAEGTEAVMALEWVHTESHVTNS